VAFLKIAAPEIVSGMSGESEQKVRELFEAAASRAPAIIFIDEARRQQLRKRNAPNMNLITHSVSLLRSMQLLQSVRAPQRIWNDALLRSFSLVWMRYDRLIMQQKLPYST
jgi:ribosome biogenesis ATPase